MKLQRHTKVYIQNSRVAISQNKEFQRLFKKLNFNPPLGRIKTEYLPEANRDLIDAIREYQSSKDAPRGNFSLASQVKNLIENWLSEMMDKDVFPEGFKISIRELRNHLLESMKRTNNSQNNNHLSISESTIYKSLEALERHNPPLIKHQGNSFWAIPAANRIPIPEHLAEERTNEEKNKIHFELRQTPYAIKVIKNFILESGLKPGNEFPSSDTTLKERLKGIDSRKFYNALLALREEGTFIENHQRKATLKTDQSSNRNEWFHKIGKLPSAQKIGIFIGKEKLAEVLVQQTIQMTPIGRPLADAESIAFILRGDLSASQISRIIQKFKDNGFISEKGIIVNHPPNEPSQLLPEEITLALKELIKR